MPTAEEPLSNTARQSKSCAARLEGRAAPRRTRRERPPADQAWALDAPPLLYAVESMQHWLDLNA